MSESPAAVIVDSDSNEATLTKEGALVSQAVRDMSGEDVQKEILLNLRKIVLYLELMTDENLDNELEQEI